MILLLWRKRTQNDPQKWPIRNTDVWILDINKLLFLKVTGRTTSVLIFFQLCFNKNKQTTTKKSVQHGRYSNSGEKKIYKCFHWNFWHFFKKYCTSTLRQSKPNKLLLENKTNSGFVLLLSALVFIYLFIKRRNECFYQKVTLGLSIFWP